MGGQKGGKSERESVCVSSLEERKTGAVGGEMRGRESSREECGWKSKDKFGRKRTEERKGRENGVSGGKSREKDREWKEE